MALCQVELRGSKVLWARAVLRGYLVSDTRNRHLHRSVQRHLKTQLPCNVIDDSCVQRKATGIDSGKQVSRTLLYRRRFLVWLQQLFQSLQGTGL